MKNTNIRIAGMLICLLLIFATVCSTNGESMVNAYGESRELIIDDAYSEVVIEENFDEKSVVVVLDKDVSGINKEHDNTLFCSINYKEITDLTYVTDSSTIRDVANFEQILQIELLHPGKENVISMIEQLGSIDGIKYAGPNRYFETQQAPNDPLYSQNASLIENQWSHVNMSTEAAWDFTVGSNEVNIGVIDTGVNIHSDLNSNIDVGYDFVYMIDEQTPGVLREDVTGHGTHVAGIIGAAGNNSIGVSGVNWNVSIVPMQVGDENGNISSLACVRAINYARETWNTNDRISILSMSIGGDEPWPEIETAIRNYQGLFVCSTGNKEQNNDITHHYPSFYASELHDNPIQNMIAVGRSDINNTRPVGVYANWGQQTISIYAPGQYILSTFPGHICQNHDDVFYDGTRMCELSIENRSILYSHINSGLVTLSQVLNNFNSIYGWPPSYYASSKHNSNGYHYMSGSSMATPQVSGTAALLLSINDSLTTLQLKEAILNSANDIVIQVPNDETNVLENQNVKLLNTYNAVKYVLANYSETMTLGTTAQSLSQYVDSSSTFFDEKNYFAKLDVDDSLKCNFTVSSTSPLEITLYDSNFNEMDISINQTNGGATNSFVQQLPIGEYYLKVNFTNENASGTIATTIACEHFHNPLLWMYLNSSFHRGRCPCGEWIQKAHVIDASQVVNFKAPCLECHALLDLRDDSVGGQMGIGKESANGSYILPNGVIVLVEEDIDAYFAGTLIFYDGDSDLLTQ